MAARGAAGDVDATPAARTWTVPHDDSQLVHSRGWKQQTVPGHDDRTVSTSRRQGSALTATVADATRLALVVATAGKVVRIDGLAVVSR